MVNPASSFFGRHGDYAGMSFRTIGPDHAPVLVLANSLGTDSRMWNTQISDWARDHRIVCFEYPGHGSATWHGEPGIRAIARKLAGLLDYLGVDGYAFCGLSMGGAVGMEMALMHPARLQALILSNTAASFGAPEFWARRGDTAVEAGLGALVDATLARWFSAGFAADHPVIVAFYRAMLQMVEPAGYRYCCDAIGAFDATERLSAIRQPTLVLAGTHDVATTVAQGRQLADAISGAAFAELDAAHLGNVGAAQAFTAQVRAFLASATSLSHQTTEAQP